MTRNDKNDNADDNSGEKRESSGGIMKEPDIKMEIIKISKRKTIKMNQVNVQLAHPTINQYKLYGCSLEVWSSTDQAPLIIINAFCQLAIQWCIFSLANTRQRSLLGTFYNPIIFMDLEKCLIVGCSCLIDQIKVLLAMANAEALETFY